MAKQVLTREDDIVLAELRELHDEVMYYEAAEGNKYRSQSTERQEAKDAYRRKWQEAKVRGLL